MDKKRGEKVCIRCQNPGWGEKDIICSKCAADIFGGSDRPMIFCKKCKDYRPMDDNEKAIAEKNAGTCLSSISGKVMLVLDSCPKCYQNGDSILGQFAFLREMPVQ